MLPDELLVQVEPSVEVSYLTPLPWYSLLYVTAMNGDNAVMRTAPGNRASR